MTKGYRPNVGMMIINADKKVLMCTRLYSEGQPYRLQMPQGGIDKGERPTQAVYREMHEEIGLKPADVRFVASTRKWYKYDLPESARKKRSIRGQRQKWFLFLLACPDTHIDLNMYKIKEFSDFQWVDFEQVPELVIPFKREVYQNVLNEFRPFVERLKTGTTVP